tara:strand:+ start:4092 stop:4934 length:843 start_codon:yes stop_codon:yes gene_type:complete
MKKVVNIQYIRSLIKTSSRFDHKGTHGHALIIAGSLGMMGAAVLATKAALRSGAGLVSVQVPKSGVDILQISAPQAMVIPDANSNFISTIKLNRVFQAIGIGPGINQSKETVSAFKELLNQVNQPLVIDADGLNILANNADLLSLIPKNSILTPHLGEFKRLVEDFTSDENKDFIHASFCQKYECYLLLKGADSSLCTPEGNFYTNSTGNEGMGKGGSGDVLTGIITAIVAQGYSPKNAAIIGMFVHGLAGDLVAEKLGKISMNSQDIIDFLPEAFIKVT